MEVENVTMWSPDPFKIKTYKFYIKFLYVARTAIENDIE